MVQSWSRNPRDFAATTVEGAAHPELGGGVGVAREAPPALHVRPLLAVHRGLVQEGRYQATWKREFKLPWREAGPPNYLNDGVDSDL